MAEQILYVRVSKTFFLLALISCLFMECFFGGLAIFSVYTLVKGEFSSPDMFSGMIFLLCFSLVLCVLLLIALCYLIKGYKKQIDIYEQDRMYRKIGDKVLFEIKYKDMDQITVKWGAIYILCKKGYYKAGKKVISKVFSEYYTKDDIYRIRKMISSNNYYIKFVG